MPICKVNPVHHAICLCSSQDVLKLMSMTRKMLMSIAKVTCAAQSVRLGLPRLRLIVPLASMVMVILTNPPSKFSVTLEQQ